MYSRYSPWNLFHFCMNYHVSSSFLYIRAFYCMKISFSSLFRFYEIHTYLLFCMGIRRRRKRALICFLPNKKKTFRLWESTISRRLSNSTCIYSRAYLVHVWYNLIDAIENCHEIKLQLRTQPPTLHKTNPINKYLFFGLFFFSSSWISLICNY